MRSVILCLCAAIAIAGQPYLACPPLIVYTQVESAFPDAIWRIVRNEVESVLSPTGWHVNWEDRNNTRRGISVSLVVVCFKGACTVDDLGVYSAGDATLGQTHVRGGDIIPFADVMCDAIRALIADRLSVMTAEQQRLWYGRAVGRVVAHELYHILTREKHHGGAGVAQAGFSVEEVLAQDFRFDTEQVHSLRRSLVPIVLSVLEWPGGPLLKNMDGAALFIRSGCSGCHGVLANGTEWGPPVRTGVDAATLARRLKGTHHEMYRRAKTMQLLWPPLTTADVNEIATFLNGFPAPGAVQAQSAMIATPEYAGPPMEYLKERP